MFKGFANVVLPTHDLGASVSDWTRVLGQEPVFVGDDFAVFAGNGVHMGLSSRPWVNFPLVFWRVDDIEQAYRTLLERGARALGEVADGSLTELGTAEITNGDPSTGIVDLPGGRLAVFRVPDGNLIALAQENAT